MPQEATVKLTKIRLGARKESTTTTDKTSSSSESQQEEKVWKEKTIFLQIQQEEKVENKKNTLLPGAEWIQHLLSAPLVEVSIAYLVIVSSILVAVGTLPLNPSLESTIENSQNLIAFAFVWEFVARWYAAFGEMSALRYFSQPLVLVDLVVVVLPVILPLLSGAPPWLTSQTGLTNLRLLRILRLQRVLQDLETFSTFTNALGLGYVKQVQPYQLQLARVILSLFTLLSVSAGLIYAAEHGVNQEMDNYFSALYYALTTLTTVGLFTPVTSQGRLVVSASILAGVVVIPAQAAALVESLMNAQDEKKLEERVVMDGEQSSTNNKNKTLPSSAVDAKTPCPSCGATFHWTSAKYCWSCGSELRLSS